MFTEHDAPPVTNGRRLMQRPQVDNAGHERAPVRLVLASRFVTETVRRPGAAAHEKSLGKHD